MIFNMVMKGKVSQIEGMKFIASSGKHTIFFDDGETSITPMEALLLSLATCTAMDVQYILEKKRCPIEHLEIAIEGTRRVEYPQIFTYIKIEFIFKGNVDEKTCTQAINLSIRKYCSIAGMINSATKIETSHKIIESF